MKRCTKRLTLVLIGASAVCGSAYAAGIDSRTISCGNLQGLIAAHGFIFLGQPFGDFVVASPYYCGSGQVVQLRSVPTADNPQCLVNYCTGREKFD